MNSTFFRLRGFLCALGLGLLALGTTACTDHGPVGLFSQELFDKNIGLPQMDIGGALNISYTTSAGSFSSAFNGTLPVSIYLINTGGSSTYGPLQVVFSSPDARMMFTLSNGTSAVAFAANATGTEIPPSQTAFLNLQSGYRSNGQNTIVDYNSSFQFWYDNSGNPYNGATHAVPVDLLIQDALNNTWTRRITLYIVT